MIKKISNYKLLCFSGKKCISYKSGKLYVHNTPEEAPEFLLWLPATRKKKIVCHIRLLERLFRMEPRIAVSIDENTFLLTCQGAVYKVNTETKDIIAEHHYRPGMNNALDFCQFDDGTGANHLLYGEYFGNTEKESVAIYSRDETGSWDKVYEFPAGTIAHIHGIVYDGFNNRFIIMTGDADKESVIWVADIDFKKVEVLVGGKQIYRSCVAFPVKDGLVYATDSPIEDNAIYWLHYTGGKPQLQKLYDLPGPCIYGAGRVDDGITKFIFATSVEPDSTLPSLKYRLTYKLGNGVKSRKSHIIAGNLEEGFKDICQFQKDIYPIWLFQFGNVQFPHVPNNCNILMTPVSVTRFDGKTITVDI